MKRWWCLCSGQATLISQPSNASSSSPSRSHNSETTDSVPDIVGIGREAQHGVRAVVGECGKKCFQWQMSVVW